MQQSSSQPSGSQDGPITSGTSKWAVSRSCWSGYDSRWVGSLNWHIPLWKWCSRTGRCSNKWKCVNTPATTKIPSWDCENIWFFAIIPSICMHQHVQECTCLSGSVREWTWKLAGEWQKLNISENCIKGLNSWCEHKTRFYIYDNNDMTMISIISLPFQNCYTFQVQWLEAACSKFWHTISE